MRLPLLCLLALLVLAPLRAAEPFFKKGDVIALVGGEDMVVASEYGYLELLLTRALPDYHLRFRNLAWEGDTVFEQRRDLNFPTWEEQLDQIGATVVIAQFGQMESLAAAEGASTKEGIPFIKFGATDNDLPPLPQSESQLDEHLSVVLKKLNQRYPRPPVANFITAYEKLIQRFGANGKRRIVLVGPSAPWLAVPGYSFFDPRIEATQVEIERLAKRLGALAISTDYKIRISVPPICLPGNSPEPTAVEREAMIEAGRAWDQSMHTPSGHLSAAAHRNLAEGAIPDLTGQNRFVDDARDFSLRQLIIAKNKLWFDYWRPQNWAFLAGDRINQPSSRDWRDPSIRWFPPEREAFLPLIAAKEKEIDALAAQLAGK
jgi:hypothetical protein